jgi:tetratricopeptide (TPR) repeat protein
VSRIGLALVAAGLLELLSPKLGARHQNVPLTGQEPVKTSNSKPPKLGDSRQLFVEGESALRNGDLETAEKRFRQVLEVDPQSAGAYANLGVIAMKRHQWKQALPLLRKAEEHAPQVAGIRLNIGLVYYRQADYRHAIAPFESVVKDQPDLLQARYLLGQCYFFTERWVEAVDTLVPLWEQESRDMNYLYVLDIAADKAERPEVRERALARMIEVGGGSPEFHLHMGRARLNEGAYDDAIAELAIAARENPKLPFAHFYLGLTYSKKGDYARAKEELLKDIELEPDVVYNYDELGNVCSLMGQDAEAERAYRKALQLAPQMLNPHMGLVKMYQRQGQWEKALAELDRADKLDPDSSRIHYLRGQVLVRMGRKEEGKKELDRATDLSNASLEQRRREMEGNSLPNPELIEEPR